MYTVIYRRYDFDSWLGKPNTNYRYLPSGERVSIGNLVIQQAVANLARVHFDSIGMFPLGKLILSESGTLPVPPADSISVFGERTKSINKDFKKRCASGEIVMSPYTHVKSVASYLPKDRFSSRRSLNGNYNMNPRALGPEIILKNAWFWDPYYPGRKEYEYPPPCYPLDGYPVRLRDQVISTPVYQYTETVGYPADPTVKPSKLNEDIHAFVESRQTLNNIIIQETVAKANAGDLDVLTALAELPKTLTSIWDGFALIAKIFKDAKRREFKIWATVPQCERRYATIEHKKYIANKLRKIPSFERWSRGKLGTQPLSSLRRDYDEFVFLRKAKIADLETFIQNGNGKWRKRALREVTEAVASVHLNVQYNIKPAVYTIEDSLKAIAEFESTYRRYGTGPTPEVIQLADDLPFPVSGAIFEGTATMEKRVLIKRRYNTGDAFEKLKRVAMADALVTGYELIKLWSIIFDWFFTIGPMLRALPWNQVYEQQKSCYNYKTVIKGKWSWNRDGITHHAHIDYRGFRREIINPHASIGIYWNPEIDITRALSGLSFLFMSLNGTLKRRYA